MSLRYNPKKPSILKKDLPKKTRTPKEVEKLQPISQNNIRLDKVLSRQWNLVPSQLNPDFQAHIQKYRDFLPKLVSRYQLYSIFPNNQTFIDQEIDQLFEDQRIKRILLQDNDDLNDLIMKNEDYRAVLNEHSKKSNDINVQTSIENFINYLDENPKSLKIPKDLIIKTLGDESVSILIKLGFLQIIPQSTTKTLLKISIPKYGYIINLYQTSRKFIVKTINTNKWREIKHNDLYEKWEKNKLKFKDFKGLNLNWILHWLIGEGTLEVFEIGDGKAYRIISK
ncbi:unnamed protein product [Wickerhamomyces anomalus]